MSHLHWMKLYIGDELAMAAHMSNAEFGSYVFLKMHYWQFGRLPVDDSRLARIARVTAEEWRDIKPTIEVLFDDDWGSARMDELRAEAEDAHQKRVEAGRKGGRPRKEEKQSYKHSFSVEKAKPKQPEPEPAPDPYSASGSAPEPAPINRALEEKEFEEGTAEGSIRRFAIPPNIAEGRRFLIGRKIPKTEIDRCLRMLMAGELTPFDIEEWTVAVKRDAA